MEPSICSLCLDPRPAEARCSLCGRPVCMEHYDPASGLCTACLESMCQVCGRRLAVSSCSACGRLVCSECGIQVSPAVRLCPSCYRRYGGHWPPPELVRESLSTLRLAVSRLAPVPGGGF